MKIALIGYGKMGRTIEKIALQKGHEIILKIDLDNGYELTAENLTKADVAIEFTGPASAADNLRRCIDAGVPVVCGSTGWLNEYESIKKAVEKKDGTFLYASNFSIGVNIFFELNKKLASLMAAHPDYRVSIRETHHTQKKDAPSGTAITLAEQVLENISNLKSWVNHPSSSPEELPITSERLDPAPGTHEVIYRSAIDDLEIKHTAHSREGFASGAVLAAEYICHKKGIFSMKDVLGF
ncbi:MAG: 4-hydroxy-tetrahydrodipicolinate reductase [Bacteroidota bacterium]|nr:4-hydroxy-tetrahydrodipicolinate reductase [Bacteroidota bacterium]MDP4213741.1 4-hydroxy-tetrahydrodipicolinate reductase [Bacteroidota bacterium]MDP4248493.1 4-hydroxy-tetrahydrodipicolinate reductase [Bacteroidota bacterium]